MFGFVMDWSGKGAVKRQLVEGLDMTRGPGRGLDIPKAAFAATPEERSRLKLAERALEELLIERKDLTVGRFKKHNTLFYRRDFGAVTTQAMESQMAREGFLAEAGDTLLVNTNAASVPAADKEQQ